MIFLVICSRIMVDLLQVVALFLAVHLLVWLALHQLGYGLALLSAVDTDQKRSWFRFSLMLAPLGAIGLNFLVLDMSFGGDAAVGCKLENPPSSEITGIYVWLLKILPLILIVELLINRVFQSRQSKPERSEWLIDVEAMSANSKRIAGYTLTFTDEGGWLSVQERLPEGCDRNKLKEHFDDGCRRFLSEFRRPIISKR